MALRCLLALIFIRNEENIDIVAEEMTKKKKDKQTEEDQNNIVLPKGKIFMAAMSLLGSGQVTNYIFKFKITIQNKYVLKYI